MTSSPGGRRAGLPRHGRCSPSRRWSAVRAGRVDGTAAVEVPHVPGTDKGVVPAGGAWDTPLVTSDGSVTYGTGNPYQSASWAGHGSPRSPALHGQRGEARRGHRSTPVALPGRPERLQGLRPPGVADLRRGRGNAGDPRLGKDGIVYAPNARTGRLLWRSSVDSTTGTTVTPAARCATRRTRGFPHRAARRLSRSPHQHGPCRQ